MFWFLCRSDRFNGRLCVVIVFVIVVVVMVALLFCAKIHFWLAVIFSRKYISSRCHGPWQQHDIEYHLHRQCVYLNDTCTENHRERFFFVTYCFYSVFFLLLVSLFLNFFLFVFVFLSLWHDIYFHCRRDTSQYALCMCIQFSNAWRLSRLNAKNLWIFF